MSGDHKLPEQEDTAQVPFGPMHTATGDASKLPGTRIGPYKLLQQLGEGGFGIVYMAEQEKPVHRRVALKIIKPGMDSAQVIARFEAERQALALMDNQNIAKVLDAGNTETGRPFFVMELVQGVPITSYCDDNHLTVRERLELFVPACKAIQHAHQKGLIHRDLKPSNVLVSLYDGQPVPKVIDFGVAKAIDSTSARLTEHTMFTQYGQIIGTFEYMSPEQAEPSRLGIDTRSDIYSLGVMLFELLTGSTPLERQRLREVGLTEKLKMIKEEEPPKPSTRIGELSRSGMPSRTDPAGQAGKSRTGPARQTGPTEAAKVASARHTQPVQLGKLLRGELDWVVMKCLEKDRARRYETANGLARDIERYLHDEPVEAGPPGAAYRLSKLARKHRTALASAGIFIGLLVLASGVSTWQAVRATRAERQALTERDRAEQEKNRAEASFRMARDTVDRFFTQVGMSPQLKAQGMEKFRKDMLQNAKDFYDRFIQEQLDAPEVRHDLGLAHLRLAKIQQALGDYAAAQTLSEKAIAILGELAAANPDASDYQRDLAASHSGLGGVYFDTGRLDQAKAACEQALAIQEKLAALHPEVAEYRRDLATSQDGLGFVDYRAGRFEQAQARQELALATWKQLVGRNAPVPDDRRGLASVEQRLGRTYADRGQSENAEAMLKDAAGNYQTLVHGYPDVPDYRHSLARTYMALGVLYFNNMRQNEKSEASLEQALKTFEKLAQEHPDVLEYVYDQGHCYSLLASAAEPAGRSDVALARCAKAIEILEQVVRRGYSQGRRDLFNARVQRALVLLGRGNHARATEEANALAAQEGLSPNNLFNITCVFARSSAVAQKDTKLSAADRASVRARYADRAIDFLRQAVGKGFQNAVLLKTDPDLAPLRSREDFQKLTEQVAQKTKK
jgi:serine/threonine protein kinase/tetratricopeptide (TPR) repeat protein